jgi:hypothetical protein
LEPSVLPGNASNANLARWMHRDLQVIFDDVNLGSICTDMIQEHSTLRQYRTTTFMLSLKTIFN